MEKPKRFLIVRTDRIGDVVLTLPLADVIKKFYPNAYIAMLVRQYTSELSINYKSIDETIIYDNNGRKIGFLQLLKVIKSYNFDVAISVFPRFRLALILSLAKIPIRIGTAYRFYSFLFNIKIKEHRKFAQKHELEYNLNLLKPLGIEPPSIKPPWLIPNSEHINSILTKLNKLGINRKQKLVVVHPGTGGSTRSWSITNFALLCKKLSDIDDIQILLTGTQKENYIIKKLLNEIGNTSIPFLYDLTLMEYAALVQHSKVFVGNSTGPLHIAAAVGTPVVGLYPQIPVLSAKRWGPYTDKCKILSPKNKPDDCKKCKKLEKCECMDSISVDEVFEAVKFFLN
ncbi:MAG: ADP-heptose--lipooligosaccharide heptosyltransferase II [Ignavibacteriae bacterium]|nr:MAG: ADP-heptose--lipooligosaccharide heptosyltransferase II [Ignavibacteriota bacterium]